MSADSHMQGHDQPTVRHVGDLSVTAWDDPVRGKLHFRPIFDSAHTATSALTSGVAEFGPGDWLGMHFHPQPETYHVLDGVGVLRVDGEEQEIVVGSSVFIPGNAHHSVRHAGGPRLRLFYAFAVDSHDDVEYHWP